LSRDASTLRTLHSQVQFEIVRAATEVVQAADVSSRAAQRAAELATRVASYLDELRQIMGRPLLNAPQLEAMLRWHRAEEAEQREWQLRTRRARLRETQLREALAGLRSQERSFERALLAERRRRELRIQAADAIGADELWLQHSWREAG
jgi:hypothetical protein